MKSYPVEFSLEDAVMLKIYNATPEGVAKPAPKSMCNTGIFWGKYRREMNKRVRKLMSGGMTQIEALTKILAD